MKCASTYDEIKPLNELCKAGKLFEVQEWIAAGKPVNLPPPKKGARAKCPLEISIERGFHSLVQVLLEGGASIDDPRYSPLSHAISEKRIDLVKLLIKQGADIKSVDMVEVFETWEPKMMDWFIDHDADVETGRPLAWALCYKIRTALGVLKRYKKRFPSFQEQANIALRHHCKERNLKWISLMLWAGADPYAKGLDFPSEEDDPEMYESALGWAAWRGIREVFEMKQVRLDPKHTLAPEILRDACYADNAAVLKLLLEKGFPPNNQKNGGSRLFGVLTNTMTWSFDFDPFSDNPRKNIDTSRSREKIKMVYLLAAHGAKWIPEDRGEISETRRSLLKMSPDYTVEFLWIMSQFKACSLEDAKQLMRTPSIKTLCAKHLDRIGELIESL